MPPDTEAAESAYISVKDAAEILGMPPYSVLELLNSGAIKSRRKVDFDSLLDYAAGLGGSA